VTTLQTECELPLADEHFIMPWHLMWPDLRRARSDGKRFVVRAEEKLTAFMELESAVRKL